MILNMLSEDVDNMLSEDVDEWAMVWMLREGQVTQWQVYEDTARELTAHQASAAPVWGPSRADS